MAKTNLFSLFILKKFPRVCPSCTRACAYTHTSYILFSFISFLYLFLLFFLFFLFCYFSLFAFSFPLSFFFSFFAQLCICCSFCFFQSAKKPYATGLLRLFLVSHFFKKLDFYLVDFAQIKKGSIREFPIGNFNLRQKYSPLYFA